MSKAALVVGIDFYEKASVLKGCVNDANSITELLSYHENGDRNFEVKELCAPSQNKSIRSNELLKEIKELFSNQHNDTVIFYFSGHGGMTPENTGYIVTSDTNSIETSILMTDLIKIVNASSVKNKIIIMDTCHSGAMGTHPDFLEQGSCIGDGVSILTASSKEQLSIESGKSSLDRHGVFTRLFIDALEGGAPSILGQITPGSIYAHVDKALGNFGQRPIFKTNTNRFIEIRKVEPSVEIRELREISSIFKDSNQEFQLDQTYELDKDVPDTYKDKKPCITEHNRIFRILQNLNRVNLVLPIGVKDMYYASMDEKACKLTPLGQFYWNLSHSRKL